MRRPLAPAELRARPFTRRQALSVGLTDDHLRSSAWRRLLRDVYVSVELPDTPELRAAAASLVLPHGAVIGYTAAAWLHGADVRVSPLAPIEVVVGRGDQLRRAGLRATSALIEPSDIAVVRGVPVTSPVRTAFDLARRSGAVEAIVRVDAMLNRGGCALDALTAYVASHAGWPGVVGARRALAHVDAGSQSPMESRMRMALVHGGLPRPQTQIPVGPEGLPFAFLDLGYEAWRVGADYDGEPHRDRWRYDLARQERVRDHGWWHRRFTALDARAGWGPVVRQVGGALLAAGWRP